MKIQNQNFWDAVSKGKLIEYMFILEKSLITNLNSEKDRSWGGPIGNENEKIIDGTSEPVWKDLQNWQTSNKTEIGNFSSCV